MPADGGEAAGEQRHGGVAHLADGHADAEHLRPLTIEKKSATRTMESEPKEPAAMPVRKRKASKVSKSGASPEAAPEMP